MMKRNRMVLLIVVAALFLTAGASAADKIPNFLKDVKVGEWVLYQVDDDKQQRSVVTVVTEKEVTLRNETIANGEVVQTDEETLVIAEGLPMDYDPDTPQPKVTESKVTLKDKEIPCTVVEMAIGPIKMRVFLSNAVPIMGLVKSEMETDGEVKEIIKLKDFGFKE